MKDTLCLHKHFSPLSSSNEFEIQNIIDVYHFVQSFITRHSTHTHDVYYLFCAEKATLSLLISIYLSVYGLFTPVCCVVWKVIYKRGRAVSTSTIHRTNSCIVHLLVLRWETANRALHSPWDSGVCTNLVRTVAFRNIYRNFALFSSCWGCKVAINIAKCDGTNQVSTHSLKPHGLCVDAC